MCDYSLESYQSRPAQQGESFTLSRFPSGSLGFIAGDNSEVAVCLSCDMRLKLEGIPENVQSRYEIGAIEAVTFAQIDGGLYRDAVLFGNGRVARLQVLGPGVRASVQDALSKPIETLKLKDEVVA